MGIMKISALFPSWDGRPWLPVIKRIIQYLGGPLNLVGTQHPATFSNANFYRLLVQSC